MTIHTKYNVGDIILLLEENKVVRASIQAVGWNSATGIRYFIKFYSSSNSTSDPKGYLF